MSGKITASISPESSLQLVFNLLSAETANIPLYDSDKIR